MIKKTWLNILFSIVVGFLATWASTIYDTPGDCSGALTCYLNKGFPFPALHGGGLAGMPWVIMWVGLLIDALFWVSIALFIFVVIIPFIRKRLLKKAK